MIPPRLKVGDEIRVICASKNMKKMKPVVVKMAKKRFYDLGFDLTFGAHAFENDLFNSSKPESRAIDINEAFKDKKVKMILAATGGFNVNQVLNLLDYNLIKRNPKIICGYSDITALSNAIFAKTGLVNYSGPNFSTFAEPDNMFKYTYDYFKKCMMESGHFTVNASKEWTDDKWYKIKEVKFHKNKGYYAINEGSATGRLIGGNICTLNLLQGTSYMPSLKGSILFLEEDDETTDVTDQMFERCLQSLLQQKGSDKIRGIVIGRFQRNAFIKRKNLEYVISSKKELRGIPVIVGADFGHTYPLITFPIGGSVRIESGKKSVIEILTH
ncbi:LD-carboxypeptidase [Candidatus Tiddalikarchaeum anstoanum]|nr:LD-carboxypeptidase [Candidatus Tiddalikarchaeum anstoanum]